MLAEEIKNSLKNEAKSNGLYKTNPSNLYVKGQPRRNFVVKQKFQDTYFVVKTGFRGSSLEIF